MAGILSDKFKDFKVLKSEWIDEVKCQLTHLRHEPTCCEVIHLGCDDPENVFGILFGTPADDETGKTHILEHLALTGSKRFKSRDPFFSMIKRSLNTFMNAFTGMDWTCYPAASMNKKDYFNLLEVYIDSCFYPTLTPLNFAQEGHRFCMKDDKLSYGGVVYNEMLGVMGNPTSRLHYEICKELLFSLPYRHNSGGDPKYIPTLTHQELVNYHRKHYTPSNATFFLYGDIPLEDNLTLIRKQCLEDAPKASVRCSHNVYPKQERFEAPKIHHFTYPVSVEKEDETYFTLSWLQCGIEDQETVLALTLLDSILFENDSSLVTERILESGLCKQASGYLDSELSEVPYILFCIGTKKADSEKLEKVILDALREVSESPIDQERIDAALHSLMFERFEITNSSYPYGLSNALRMAFLHLQNQPIENGLRVHSLIESLREMLKDPMYLSKVVKEQFVDNPHRLTAVMSPSSTMGAKEEDERAKKLQSIQETLSKEDIASINKLNDELKKLQEEDQTELINQLPTIRIDEITPTVTTYPLDNPREEVFTNHSFTNNIIYCDLIYPLPYLTIEESLYAKIFFALFAELGTSEYPWHENLQRIQRHTGGVSLSLGLNPQSSKKDQFKPTISFSFKALEENVPDACKIVREMLTQIDLSDQQRIKDLIKQLVAAHVMSLSQNPRKFGNAEAASSYSLLSAYNKQFSGLPYLAFLLDVEKKLDENMDQVQSALVDVSHKILHFNDPKLVVGGDENCQKKLEQSGFGGLLDLKPRDFVQWSPLEIKWERQWSLIPLAMPVVYCALVIPSVGREDPHHVPLMVAAKILNNTQLHSRLREKHGSYGSGAGQHPESATFMLTSYRDPQALLTYQEMKKSIEEMAAGKFTRENIEEAIRNIIKGTDNPCAPGHRAGVRYAQEMVGLTPEVRQKLREGYLKIDREAIIDATKEVLLNRLPDASFMVIGNEAIISRDQEALEKETTLEVKIVRAR